MLEACSDHSAQAWTDRPTVIDQLSQPGISADSPVQLIFDRVLIVQIISDHQHVCEQMRCRRSGWRSSNIFLRINFSASAASSWSTYVRGGFLTTSSRSPIHKQWSTDHWWGRWGAADQDDDARASVNLSNHYPDADAVGCISRWQFSCSGDYIGGWTSVKLANSFPDQYWLTWWILIWNRKAEEFWWRKQKSWLFIQIVLSDNISANSDQITSDILAKGKTVPQH